MKHNIHMQNLLLEELRESIKEMELIIEHELNSVWLTQEALKSKMEYMIVRIQNGYNNLEEFLLNYEKDTEKYDPIKLCEGAKNVL